MLHPLAIRHYCQYCYKIAPSVLRAEPAEKSKIRREESRGLEAKTAPGAAVEPEAEMEAEILALDLLT